MLVSFSYAEGVQKEGFPPTPAQTKIVKFTQRNLDLVVRDTKY